MQKGGLLGCLQSDPPSSSCHKPCQIQAGTGTRPTRTGTSSPPWSSSAGPRRGPAPSAASATRPSLCGAVPQLACHGMRQTLPGSFSAASKRNFASKYALVTRCYAKQDEVVLRCMSPRSVCIKFFFHLKMLRISSH